jgi:hypothetical protein
MCNCNRLKLSPVEKEAMRKFSGILIPIYASAAFLLIAVIALSDSPRSNGSIAVADTNAAAVVATPLR